MAGENFYRRYYLAQGGDTAAKRLKAREIKDPELVKLAARHDDITTEGLAEWRKERGVE